MSKKNFTKKMNISWRTSLILMLAVFWLGNQNLVAQAGSASATYTAGDIETQISPLQTTSLCAEELVVNIPTGKIITGVDVAYTMTTGVDPSVSPWEGYMSEQRSRIACLNPGGIIEPNYSNGSGNEGTFTYNRTGLNIAENVTGGGDIIFQMNAFRMWGGTGCNGLINKVDNNSWTITVHYDDPPSCPVPTNLTVSNITSNGAQIDWDPVSEASDGFQWLIVPEGQPEFDYVGEGITTSSTTTATFSSLTPNTPYDIYLRALCGVDGVSEYSVLNFSTLCEALSIPWSENFDGLTTGAGNIPDCWSLNNNSGVQVTASASQSGITPISGSAFIWHRWNSNNDIYTPRFNFTASESYRFSFSYRESNGSSGHVVNIYAGTSPDIASMSNIGTITNPTNTTWEEFFVDYEAPTTNEYYFAINIVSDGVPWYLGFDEFSVDLSPTCFTPNNIQVNSITNEGATFTWDAEATAEDGYEWAIMPQGDAPDPSTAAASTSTTFLTETVTGLDPNTSYSFYVRSDCSMGDNSAWSSPLNFTTLCNAVADFSEDFNSTGTGNIPDCWSRIVQTGSTFSSIGVSSFEDFTLPNAVRMSNGFTTTGDMIAVSPQLSTLGDGTYWLKLDALATNASNNLIIGTLSDPNDATTFTPIETLDLSTSLQSFEVLFTSYTGTDTYIGFKRELATTSNSVYFDNVVWEVAPTCFPPDNLGVSNISSTSLDLSWDVNPDAEEGYEWVVMPEGEAPNVGTASATDTSATNSASVTGLTAETDYSVYVRSVCSVGDESAWTAAVDFTTTVSCALPTNVTATSPYGFAAEFNWDASLTATDGYEWGVYLQGESPMVGDTPIDSGTVAAGTIGFDIDTLDPNTGYLFFIRSICDTGVYSDWLGAAFFTVDGCPIATGYTVDNITPNSADFTWEASPNPTANDYQWRIVEAGGNPEVPSSLIDSGTVGASGPFSVSTTSLLPNTSYDFNVRIACSSGGFSDVGDVITFTTPCNFVDTFPYLQGFEGFGANLDPCWRANNLSGTGNWEVGAVSGGDSFAPNSGSHLAYLRYNGPLKTAELISVPFDFTAIPGPAELSVFLHRHASASSTEDFYRVYVNTSPTLTGATEVLEVFSRNNIAPTVTSNGFHEYTVDIPSAFDSETEVYVIIFGSSNGWDIAVDDLTVREKPSCVVPVISSSSATATSISIDWLDEATATSGYGWVIMPQGLPPDNSGIVSTSSVTIPNLTPNTTYDVAINSRCGGFDLSDYVYVTITTPPLEASPWAENFNVAGQTGWSLAGWNRGTTTTSAGVEGRDGSAVIRRNLYGTGSNQFGFFETVNVGPIQAGDYLSYEYRLKDFFTPNDALASGACTFTVTGVFSTSGSVILQSFSNDDKLGWQKKYIDLSDYEGETVQLSVLATANSEDFWIYFDNFAIKNVDGYVYADDSQGWLTGNPAGVSTDSDLVEVVEGSASFSNEVVADELVVFAQASLDIEDVLDLDGELYTDGDVTFKSNATKTGQLASASVVRGQVTTERFVPAEDNNTRGFRFITPTVDGGSIFNNWQEAGASPLGFGTHITGSTTGANGFDQTITGNPSLFVFDNTAATQAGGVAWIPAANTTSNLVAGTPYRIFVRGDRTIDLTEANPTPNNTVLRAKGNLVVGNRTTATFASDDLQFSFFGNPYQAIVDLKEVTFNGDVNPNYAYVWDINSGTSGSYVTVEISSGTNTMSSNANNLLQPGQAVFIRNNSTVTTAPSIEFTEASKNVSGSQLTTFSTPTHAVLNVQLISPNNNGLVLDGIGMRFDDLFDNAVGDEDAGKIGNSGENMAIVRSNQLLSIERRNYPFQGETHQLFVNNLNLTNYALKIQTDNFNSDLDLFVVDHYLGTETLITTDSEYHFTVNSTVPASSHPLRFELKFDVISLGNENALAQNISLYPVPVKDRLNIQYINEDSLAIEVINLLGQVVNKVNVKGNTLHQVDMKDLPSGVYLVKVSSANETFTQQVIKK